MSDDNDDWSEKTDMTRIEDLSDFLHEEDPEVDEKLEKSEEENNSFKEVEDNNDFLSQDDDETENDNNELADDSSFGNSDEFEEETQPNFEIPEEFSQGDHQDETDDQDDFEQSEDVNESSEFDSFSDNEEDSEENSEDNLENDSETEFNSDFSLSEEEDDTIENSVTLETPELPDTSDVEAQSLDENINEFIQPLETPNLPIESVNTTHKTQENFQELREYGNAISYGNVTTGGNPPFSIILRNIIYKEDAEDIFSILKEFGVVTTETEHTTRQGLDSGSLLISQISEYSAIFLAHKFRRFNLDIRIGLSEQLHHSKSYEGNGKGLVTKDNIHQNINEEVLVKHKISDVKDVILVTTTNLNDFDVHRYIEVITSHTLISHEQLEDIDAEVVSYHTSINHIYQELATELKSQAYKRGANAVTGINYSLSPLPIEKDSTKQLYKVTCFGNAVLAIFKSKS
jgi:uncharacterized protein YbjQ (UPF0145 family)